MRVVLTGLLTLWLTGSAWADRTASVRSNGLKVSSAGPTDIRIPYLTTGDSAFGAYRVAPRIYATPVTDDSGNPGTRPTFNLPFYGGRMGFSATINGYVPKPALLPSNAK